MNFRTKQTITFTMKRNTKNTLCKLTAVPSLLKSVFVLVAPFAFKFLFDLIWFSYLVILFVVSFFLFSLSFGQESKLKAPFDAHQIYKFSINVLLVVDVVKILCFHLLSPNFHCNRMFCIVFSQCLLRVSCIFRSFHWHLAVFHVQIPFVLLLFIHYFRIILRI